MTSAIIEAERGEVAAEIHDVLLPYLYAAAAKLSSVRQLLRAENEPPKERLDERLADVADWIDQSRDVARTLMNGITHPPLALADPLAAAKAFLDQFAHIAGDGLARVNEAVDVNWSWDGMNSPLADRLAPPTAIATYRLTIEFTRNALRHANASHIEVSAEIVGETAIVRITDDGCGFDPQGVDTTASHGLALAPACGKRRRGDRN